jgi:hypothetical protein
MSAAKIPFGWKGSCTSTLLDAGVYLDLDGRVRVPYRLVDGSTFREKIFTARGSYWGPGNGIVPFGLEALAPREQRQGCSILIAEGESDALAIRGAICGWRCDRLDVLSIPGAGTWREAWEEHIRGYLRVYVVADGDAAGRAMVDRIRGAVPVGVRPLAMPPGEDSRSIIQSLGGVEWFADLLADADKLAAQTLAFRLATTPEDWERHMVAMRDEGMWS